LVAQHGSEALHKLKFRNCNPVVRVMIESALGLGLDSSLKNGPPTLTNG